MKKVGIIAFHTAYNYGPMLRAYTLQQVTLSMGYNCEIINFRSPARRRRYKPIFVVGSLYSRCVRFIIQTAYVWGILKKQRLSKQFSNSELKLSYNEYGALEDLKNAGFNYDYYISGNDQIWDIYCNDSNYAYFLPFIKSGRRIAYAPSMGAQLSIRTCKDRRKVINLLNQCNAVSARETVGTRYVGGITKMPTTSVLDPTLLLNPQEYDSLVDDKPLVRDEYVSIYSSNFTEKVNEMAEALGNKYNKQVIISQEPISKNAMLEQGRKFNIYTATSPREFLNLCENISIICCDSFHAVAFSTLFKKCFFVLDRMRDNRISNLLQIAHLRNRNLSSPNEYFNAPLQMDLTQPLGALEIGRRKGLEWLKEHLDVCQNEILSMQLQFFIQELRVLER